MRVHTGYKPKVSEATTVWTRAKLIVFENRFELARACGAPKFMFEKRVWSPAQAMAQIQVLRGEFGSDSGN